VSRGFALVALLALAGCAAPSEPLDAAFAPLVRVEQDETGLVRPHMLTTIETVSYVPSLAVFDADYPPGSLARHAVLDHERLHAERQAALGARWFALYAAYPSFRWSEESLGWAVELKERLAGGEVVFAGPVAALLSGPAYTDPLGRTMVDYVTALTWAVGVGCR